jgi:hypothetical protein
VRSDIQQALPLAGRRSSSSLSCCIVMGCSALSGGMLPRCLTGTPSRCNRHLLHLLGVLDVLFQHHAVCFLRCMPDSVVWGVLAWHSAISDDDASGSTRAEAVAA